MGQGPDIAPLNQEIREAIENSGPGVEIMSTPSACRTYNVLLAEDRRVAAILTAL
ncbi:MAG: Mth938-like domain-containing protein [Pseudomonadota bacterium]